MKMVDIVKDKSTNKISMVYTCHRCPEQDYPKGKPIGPWDTEARMIGNEPVCGECIRVDRRKDLISKLGNDHSYSRFVIDQEQQQVDKWNNLAKKASPGMKPKKNKYVGIYTRDDVEKSLSLFGAKK